MTKSGLRLLIWAAALVFVCFGAVLGRNYLLDTAGVAIKTGNGAAAIQKLRPLAGMGDRTAQLLLGYGYAYGWSGVPRNDDDAMYWFAHKSLFGAGSPGSSGGHGAVEALSVAKAYATGAEGVRPDPQESKKWLHLAAGAGSEEAAAELAKSP